LSGHSAAQQSAAVSDEKSSPHISLSVVQ
jgi:hypothetical protein